jgi:hypothetical protein
MISVTEGQDVVINIKGKRVAFRYKFVVERTCISVNSTVLSFP